MEAQAITVEKPFAAAEAKFTDLVTRLSTEESRRMTHSELESLITAEGREIHRRLLQGHLDLRASGEQVLASVRGADEVERTHHGHRARPLLTVFGLVTRYDRYVRDGLPIATGVIEGACRRRPPGHHRSALERARSRGHPPPALSSIQRGLR